MIYKKYEIYDFIHEFKIQGRDYYSLESYNYMYDYLDDYGSINDNCGYELDIIELCGIFTECDLDTALNDYGLDSFDELDDNTIAWKLKNNKVLYMDF